MKVTQKASMTTEGGAGCCVSRAVKCHLPIQGQMFPAYSLLIVCRTATCGRHIMDMKLFLQGPTCGMVGHSL